MQLNTAKNYALESLIWLSKNTDHLETFLISSGANLEEIRTRSKDPEFLSFVLDFIMTADELVCGVSKDLNISPDQLKMAYSALSGGDLMHWT